MIICLIPARKGSKRIKNKNIINFEGKPLIYYSIKNAIKSKIFDEIVVSTDSLEIAKIAEKYGAKVPFLRPKKISGSTATDIDVLKHYLNFSKQKKIKIDYLCYTYPTNPLLSVSTLHKCFKTLKEKKCQKVLTISKYEYPIQRALKKNKLGKIFFRESKYKNTTSQKLQTFYQDACQCYWYNLKKIKHFSNFEKFNTIGVELNNLDFVDLNSHDDLKKLKILFKLKKFK